MTKAQQPSASRERPRSGTCSDGRNAGLIALRGDLAQAAPDGQASAADGWTCA